MIQNSDVAAYLGVTLTPSQESLVDLLIPFAEGAVNKYLGYNPSDETGIVEFLPYRDGRVLGDDLIDVTNNTVRLTSQGIDADRILRLKRLPVTEVTEVREQQSAYAGQASGEWDNDTILTLGTDYFIDFDETDSARNGFIIRIGRSWPTTRRSVKVTYNAGYTTTELATGDAAPIRFATLIACVKAFTEATQAGRNHTGGTAGMIVGERLGDYGVQYAQAPSVQKNLSGFFTALPQEALELLEPFRNYSKFI